MPKDIYMRTKKMITEEQFKRYVKVQNSGITNMFDVGRVMQLSGLAREQCFSIMESYSELKEKYMFEEAE